MSTGTIDLSGNTNFVALKNLQQQIIVPRTNLAAVDLTVANGLAVTGNTLYANLATTTDLTNGTSGNLLDAKVFSTYTHSKNVIPTSAVSGFVTSAKNAASTYVHSANVIPTSAISGLATAITSGASTYVTSSGVIPVSAVTDLPLISSTYAPLAENGWTRHISAGAGVTVTTNSDNFPERDVVVALKDYDTITTIPTTSTTVTLEPGKAYKIDATTTSKTLNISAFDAGMWGRESHIELFVANAGYVHVGNNVTLVDALEPDAVNDCTVRFHDGHAIISVEDHVQAYMVNNTSATNTSGSLLYGIAQTGDTYKFIGFRSELNTSSVPTGGGTATTVKHFVGNGMDVGPTISGSIKLNSNGTFRDCKLNGLVVSAGTATLTNVLVDSGATVRVSGGALFIETVMGNGGTINLGNTHVIVSSGVPAIASGVTITGGSASYGGAAAVNNSGSMVFSGCVISGNFANYGAVCYVYYAASVQIIGSTVSNNAATAQGAFAFGSSTNMTISNSIITNNSATSGQGGAIYMRASNCAVSVIDSVLSGSTAAYGGNDVFIGYGGAVLSIMGSTVGQVMISTSGHVVLAGSNRIGSLVKHTDSLYGSVTISSGATIDLTGNTNATPINPGGGITFGANVTIINSAGTSVLLNNGTAGTCATIKKDGTTTA